MKKIYMVITAVVVLLVCYACTPQSVSGDQETSETCCSDDGPILPPPPPPSVGTGG